MNARRGAVACCIAAAAAAAQAPSNLSQLYQQLAQPRLTQTATVSNAGCSWRGLRLLLLDGELSLAAPSDGRITAAVFTGHGQLQVMPPDPIERQQMVRFTGRSEIAASFNQAVFRFADSAQFLRVLGPLRLVAAGRAHEAQGILEDRAKALEKRGSPAIARLLQALEAGPHSDLLLAELRLDNKQWLEAQYDPSQPDPLRVYAWSPLPGGGDYPNLWTQFAPVGIAAPPPAPHLDRVAMNVALSNHLELAASVNVNLVVPAGATGGLLFELDHGLRLQRVTTASGAALEWLQPPAADWFYLRLPEPLAAGQSLALTLSYQGKPPLLPSDQDGDAISAPGWYPTPGLALPWAPPPAPANFEIHYSVNPKFQLLSSGNGMSAAAGFAVGESQQDSRTLSLADGRTLQVHLAAPRHGDPEALLPLAGVKLVDILNFMGREFGPYPYASISATVTDADASQALPQLAVLNPQAFVDEAPEVTEVEPAVSVAGQWWGAWTTPATPGDEWLTAGLRAVSGLLYLQARHGPEESLPTLRAWRQALLERSRVNGHVPVALGPLVLGAARLGSNLDDGGAVLALKGAYVIYMLRQMLLQPRRPDPDADFIALMHDFYTRYGGHAVTSAEFQAVVERHMTPAMDLDHNHKMDWFFRPALTDTVLPQLRFQADSVAAAGGGEQVKLTVDNPQHWRGLLPVYFFQNDTTWLRGLMPITEDHQVITVPVPFKPQYVEANHLLDMLVAVSGR